MTSRGRGATWVVSVLAMVSCLALQAPQGLAQTVTLTAIVPAGPRYQLAVEGMAREYMKIRPDVKIVVESHPFMEYETKVALEVAAKGAAYDIIWTNYKFVGGYSDGGYLMPIDKYLTADPDFWADIRADVSASVLNTYNYKGRWYAIPADGNTQVAYYRTDIFRAAGVAAPDNWDDVLKIAPKIHKPRGMYAIGGNFRRFWATDFWLSAFFALGGKVWDETTFKPEVNSKAGVWSANTMVKLFKFSPRESLTWGEGDLFDAMGTAGIVAYAPAQWAGAVLTDPARSKLANSIKATLVPKAPGTNRRAAPMGGFGLGICAHTKQPDAVWDFIRFYAARENGRMLVGYTGQPARTSALTDPENVARRPYFRALAEMLRHAVPRPVIAEYTQAQDLIGIELNNAMLGKKTVQRALDDANRAIHNVMVTSGRIKQ